MCAAALGVHHISNKSVSYVTLLLEITSSKQERVRFQPTFVYVFPPQMLCTHWAKVPVEVPSSLPWGIAQTRA